MNLTVGKVFWLLLAVLGIFFVISLEVRNRAFLPLAIGLVVAYVGFVFYKIWQSMQSKVLPFPPVKEEKKDESVAN